VQHADATYVLAHNSASDCRKVSRLDNSKVRVRAGTIQTGL
jgi:hypothetical protein